MSTTNVQALSLEVSGDPAVLQQPATENKAQYQRVEGLLVDLEPVRAQLASQEGNSGCDPAIGTELQRIENAMSGGRRIHVGQMEAAQLSQWLTNTEKLTLVAAAEIPA